MDSNTLANALSSLSLMLAVLALLFGAWLPSATSAVAIKAARYRASRNGQLQEIRAALQKMAILAAAATLVAAVFLVRAACLVWSALTVGGKYHDLSAAFIVAEVLLVCLASYAWVLAAGLINKWRKLNRNVEIEPES